MTTCLASTRDFQSFERHGVIFHPDNKDVVIFPARIGGQFYALHRPHSSLFLRNDIWLAESPDLLCWGHHRHLMGTRDGLWDETRIGAGAVPFRIDEGWVEIYHGADRNNRYCMGAVLLDSEQPWKILARSERPLFEPQADYEQRRFLRQRGLQLRPALRRRDSEDLLRRRRHLHLLRRDPPGRRVRAT